MKINALMKSNNLPIFKINNLGIIKFAQKNQQNKESEKELKFIGSF
jgi:hypothetical protein